MDLKEQEFLREEFLRDQEHEFNMRNDIEYFTDYTLNNFYIFTENKSYIFLYDILEKLKKHCDHYDQNFNELCNYIKEI